MSEDENDPVNLNAFDFIKAFAGVDILAVEAVGEVVGRCIGALFKGMVASGMEEATANAILMGAVREMFVFLRMTPPAKAEEGGET